MSFDTQSGFPVFLIPFWFLCSAEHEWNKDCNAVFILQWAKQQFRFSLAKFTSELKTTPYTKETGILLVSVLFHVI